MSRIGHDNVRVDKEDNNETEDIAEKVSSSRRGRDNLIAGAATGAISRMLVQPFDVVKIRFQLQAEHRTKAKYKSVMFAPVSMIKEEGVRALWKGHVSGQWLSVLFAGTSYGIYQTLCDRSSGGGGGGGSKSRSFVEDVLFGTLAGVPATVISFPFDIIRTRMVGQGGPDKSSTKAQYKGVTEAFARMVKEEGPTSIFKGLAPALYTVPLYTGVQYGIYNVIKPFGATYLTRIDSDNMPYLSQFATTFFGGLTGVLAKTVTYPLDVIKKRLQVQGFAEGRVQLGRTPHYSGFADCLVKVLKHEGFFRGLFKGWVPAIVKAYPAGAIQFFLLEHLLYVMDKIRLNGHWQ